MEPHILRSLLNVKIVSVHTSCSGCHFVAIDIDGSAWLFGRNGSSALGIADVEYISENAPFCLKPTDIGAPKGTKFVHAACGRNHTVLVGSDGSVWAAGANKDGQVCSLHGAQCPLSQYSWGLLLVRPTSLSGSIGLQTCPSHACRKQGARCTGVGGDFIFGRAHRHRQRFAEFRFLGVPFTHDVDRSVYFW